MCTFIILLLFSYLQREWSKQLNTWLFHDYKIHLSITKQIIETYVSFHHTTEHSFQMRHQQCVCTRRELKYILRKSASLKKNHFSSAHIIVSITIVKVLLKYTCSCQPPKRIFGMLSGQTSGLMQLTCISYHSSSMYRNHVIVNLCDPDK